MLWKENLIQLLRFSFITFSIGYGFFFSNAFAEEKPEVRCNPDGCIALIQEAEKYGPVNLIVGIRVPALAKSELHLNPRQSKQGQREIQEKRNIVIAEVKDQVLTRLGSPKLKYIYKSLPSFALKADQALIRKLIADPEVKSITKEAPTYLQLSETWPLVGADNPTFITTEINFLD